MVARLIITKMTVRGYEINNVFGGFFAQIYKCSWSSGGRVVKLLACGARGPASPLEFSEIGYLLLPSRDMAERSLNLR